MRGRKTERIMKYGEYIAPELEEIDISPNGTFCQVVSNVDPGRPFDGNDEEVWTN